MLLCMHAIGKVQYFICVCAIGICAIGKVLYLYVSCLFLCNVICDLCSESMTDYPKCFMFIISMPKTNFS